MQGNLDPFTKGFNPREFLPENVRNTLEYKKLRKTREPAKKEKSPFPWGLCYSQIQQETSEDFIISSMTTE